MLFVSSGYGSLIHGIVLCLSLRIFMGRQLHIFVGGVDNEDYAVLVKSAGTSETFNWSSVKDALPGDRVLIYIAAPHSRMLVKAEVLTAPVKGSPGDFAYRANIGKIKLLRNQVTLPQLKKAFPRWAWLIQPRSKAYVPEQYQRKLWDMVNARPNVESSSPAAKGGAGFGNAITNRLVEKVAIRKVTRELETQGFTVRSREKENLGYDLDASNDSRLLHVEVKGISGEALQFHITANEFKQSKLDPNFHLFAVTKARSKNAVIHRFTGAMLLKKFRFNPLSFIAVPKD